MSRAINSLLVKRQLQVANTSQDKSIVYETYELLELINLMHTKPHHRQDSTMNTYTSEISTRKVFARAHIPNNP